MIEYYARVCKRGYRIYTNSKGEKRIKAKAKNSARDEFYIQKLKLSDTKREWFKVLNTEDQFLEDKIRQFADKHGLTVDNRTVQGNKVMAIAEDAHLDSYLNIVKAHRKILENHKKGRHEKVLEDVGWNSISLRYRPHEHNSADGYIFIQETQFLHGFLTLTVLDHLNARQTTRKCNFCNETYEFQRSDSKFCSDSCRARSNQLKKKEK